MANNNGKPEPKQVCQICQKEKRFRDFYSSQNPLHFSGRLPICKECINSVDEDNDRAVKMILKKVDKPFIASVWESSKMDEKSTWGVYFKNINLKQYRIFTWSDSDFDVDEDEEKRLQGKSIKKATGGKKDKLPDEELDRLEKEWGNEHSIQDKIAFDKKYEQLKENYPIDTSLHKEALKTYCLYQVRTEQAVSRGDATEAKTWGQLAQKQADSAKLNLSKLNKGDLTQGLDSFSELARMVEKEVDIIPILPKFIEKPNDKIDLAILSFVNYSRRLTGHEDVEHHEIYDFYQKKLKEYLEDDTKNPEIKKKIKEIEITTESGNKRKILFYDVYERIQERKEEYPNNSFIQNLDKWMELVSYYRWFPDRFFAMIESKEGGGIKLDSDQAMVMRSMARFQNTYCVFPRGKCSLPCS